ncbi:non-ribosomal peptide synthetase [Bacillus cereus group sp. Sample62]|uniref:non-ribosomal peptide synthetase n=1 Tax=Bacillus cereus group TaxID=86661 RepID=UPI0008689197|nr:MULTISPECIES: non-ribosomal peptide synthetase [Bacillus cereus group]SCN29866.1 Multifunctional nonribosomal peptide synthetase (Mycosubtilin synthetase) [Bacillus cereus]HDR4726501.1 non-ribosomal peptide synthetase [Bacillus cereus]HDX9550985.1 non-ribosomal peptide synthetase [Bacillus thuringiensis]
MNREYLIKKLEEHANVNPMKIAVKCKDKELTYQQFNQMTNYVAKNLLRKTGGENVIIPLRTRDNLNTLISIFGILKAGAAWLPMAKEITHAKCQAILSEIETSFFITDFETENFGKKIIQASTLMSQNNSNLEYERAQDNYRDQNISYVLYTSGTTGKPKGCLLEDKSLIQKLITLDNTFPFKENDNYLFSTNYSFDVSITEIFGWVFGGGTITLYDSTIPSTGLPKYIFEKEVTHVAFSPSFIKLFFKNQEHYFRNIKYMFIAGEKFPSDLAQKFSRAALDMQVYNLYGPTETSIYATYFNINQLSDEDLNVPIGYALDGVDIKIYKNNQLLSDGGIGEILIGGEGLAREYYKRSELTEEKFFLIDNNRYYKSGDLGYIQDGKIFYLGREDSQIKINGIRVEAEEIESTLKKIMPIEDAIVRLEEYEGKKFLTAYIKTDYYLDFMAYEPKLKEQIESYFIPKMYVSIKEYPLNKNNKVDFDKLRFEFINKLEDTNIESFEFSDAVQNSLANIWKTILKSEINVKDNFFSIGGDSLDSVALMMEIEEKFDVILSNEEIIKNSTFSKMAGVISDKINKVNIGAFKRYWGKVELDFEFDIKEENEENLLIVNQEKEKLVLQKYCENLDISVQPDRILCLGGIKQEYKYKENVVIPVSAQGTPNVSTFPLFSRQEFYLRRNFNSILLKELVVMSKDVSRVLETIKHLVNTQLLLRVVIAENKQFVEKKTNPNIFNAINYYDLSNLPYEESIERLTEIKKDTLESLSNLDIYNHFLYEIILVRENSKKLKVIFFMNHHIADAFALNVLQREFFDFYDNESLNVANQLFDYRDFTEDVLALCNEKTILDVQNSEYYRELKNNFDELKQNLVINSEAPIYEIVVNNQHKDRNQRADLVFNKIASIVEENYGSTKQCYQILKNLNTYNGKNYENQLGDYHVSIFVPFDSQNEENLFSKSELLLKDIYIDKKWHLDYLCSSEKYKDNEQMRIFPEINLSINYLGEFTLEDLNDWRNKLAASREMTAKLNTKIRITCFNYKNQSYIYILNNAALNTNYDTCIFNAKKVILN